MRNAGTFGLGAGRWDVLLSLLCFQRQPAWRAAPGQELGLGGQRRRGHRRSPRQAARIQCCIPLSPSCREAAASPAAGLTAQFVVARDGAVPGQHFHLAEDGFVSQAGLICKTNGLGMGTQRWTPGKGLHMAFSEEH